MPSLHLRRCPNSHKPGRASVSADARLKFWRYHLPKPSEGDNVQRSITIERFKGLRKLHVQKLAPFTLIGGRNDVGKSSFLEAVFLLFDRQNPAALIAHLGWRNFGSLDANTETMWAPAFYNLDVGAPIVISALGTNNIEQDVRYRIVENYVASQSFQPFVMDPIQKPTLQTHAAGVSAVGVYAKRGSEVMQDTYTTVGLGGITSTGTVNKPTGSQAIYLGSGRFVDPTAPARLTKLIAEKNVQQVVDTAKLVDARIKSIAVGAVANGTPYIMAEVEGLPKQVPLSFLGTGMGIVVNTAIALASVPNGTVLIDELETGIHHSALVPIISALSDIAHKNKTQVIATTHSYECIKAAFEVFKEKNDERFEYIRLERNKEGDVAAKIYPGDALGFAIESEWEVR
jgi:hypothetical protein